MFLNLQDMTVISLDINKTRKHTLRSVHTLYC